MAEPEIQVPETTNTEEQVEQNTEPTEDVVEQNTETTEDVVEPNTETTEDVVEEAAPKEEEEIEYVCPPEFDEREEMCKMFVGGLDKETSDEELKELFVQFGEIKDFIIIRKENNKSDRLFGFITFTKCDDLEECLLQRPHKYKEKELDVRRAVPRTSGSSGPDFLGHTKVKKLHVANVPPVCDVETLKKYLLARHPAKYGSIEEINFVKAKDDDGKPSDKNRGFGFITVSTEDFADRLAIGESKFTLDSINMRISKAKPKNPGGRYQGNNQYNQGGGGGGYNNWGGYGGNYGGGYGNYGAYGAYGGYGGGGYGPGYGGGYYDNSYGGGPQRGGRGGRFKPY